MTILPVYSGHKIGFEQKGEVLDKKNKTFFTSYIYSPKHLQFFHFFYFVLCPGNSSLLSPKKIQQGKYFK